MKTEVTRWRGTRLSLMLGIAAGAVMMHWLAPMQPSSTPATKAPARDEPLYWVAPMDPDYRRDSPGKSPMGMDLVPVYAQPDTASGVVSIAPEVENNLGVRTAPVLRAALDQTINTVGFVDYDQDRLVNVHPRVEGWIQSLAVNVVGERVTAGQPLYTLYSPELVNAQEELQLALARNNRALLDAAEARLMALGLQSTTIESLKVAREVKQALTFYAPQDGVVQALNARQGAYVTPGTSLMSIAALDSVWIEAEVFSKQTPAVSVGMAATVSVDYVPGRQWRGEVAYLYPQLDARTRTLRMRIALGNADHALQPNMFAHVALQSRAAPAVLTVPAEAIIRLGGDNRVVKALGEGRFESVTVTLGRVGDSGVEVLRGLEEGDRVVTSAQFLLDSESSKAADLGRMEAASDTPSPGSEEVTEHSGHAHHHHGGSGDD